MKEHPKSFEVTIFSRGHHNLATFNPAARPYTDMSEKNIQAAADILPEGISWGDSITPAIVIHIMNACAESIAEGMVANYLEDLEK